MSTALGAPLPGSWPVAPLKHVTSMLNRGSAPDYVDSGPVRAISQAANQASGLNWSRTRFHNFSGNPKSLKGHLRPNDVLINSTGTGTLGRVGYFTGSPDGIPCMADSHVTVARAKTGELDARFSYYWLSSRPFQDYIFSALVVGATSQIELNRDRLGDAPVPLPPLAEQRRIADFLDAETARIDALAITRDAQLSALGERELAVIGHMLSGGATSQGGQATGWQWLPYIPASWSVGPVYAYYSTELGKMLNPQRASGDNQRPYLRNANVHWYEIDTADMATMNFETSEARRYSVTAGDLLVCEGGAGVAEAAVWDGRIEECYFQKSLHRVRQAAAIPVEWLMYWLRFAKACGVFDAGGNLATIPHLTGEQLRQYRIPIPADSETLIRETGRNIDTLAKARALLDRANTKLAERRQSLITAAVTGQFDVSTARGRNVTDGVTA
ncbi:restriction endonuclease subunit S [Streptomyces albidoflavus]